VICEKPLANDLGQAAELEAASRATGARLCLMHNYSGFPMVREARAVVAAGELGRVQLVQMSYLMGSLGSLVEGDPSRMPDRLKWRLDPARGGASHVLSDIGSHAHHLGAYVSGLELDAVMADVGASVPGRTADDYAAILLRWSNGARGTLWVTNAAAGGEHGLGFRIFGAKGGLEWQQEQPNTMLHRRLEGFPELVTRRLHGALHPSAERATRTEIGHPEGYQEAFANLYADAAEAILARHTGRSANPLALDFPTVLDGARGMRFIEAALESSRRKCWVDCRLAF